MHVSIAVSQMLYQTAISKATVTDRLNMIRDIQAFYFHYNLYNTFFLCTTTSAYNKADYIVNDNIFIDNYN